MFCFLWNIFGLESPKVSLLQGKCVPSPRNLKIERPGWRDLLGANFPVCPLGYFFPVLLCCFQPWEAAVCIQHVPLECGNPIPWEYNLSYDIIPGASEEPLAASSLRQLVERSCALGFCSFLGIFSGSKLQQVALGREFCLNHSAPRNGFPCLSEL